MLKKAGLIIVGLGLLVVVVLIYHDAFKEVTVTKVQQGQFNLVGIEHQGEYKDIGEKIIIVTKFLNDNSISDSIRVGLYYDDPSKVESAKLRSFGGAIVSTDALKKLAKPLAENKIKIKVRTLKAKEYLKAEIKYVSMLSMIIGIFKAYPAFKDYSTKHEFKEYTYSTTNYLDNFALEIYNTDSILYLMSFKEN